MLVRHGTLLCCDTLLANIRIKSAIANTAPWLRDKKHAQACGLMKNRKEALKFSLPSLREIHLRHGIASPQVFFFAIGINR